MDWYIKQLSGMEAIQTDKPVHWWNSPKIKKENLIYRKPVKNNKKINSLAQRRKKMAAYMIKREGLYKAHLKSYFCWYPCPGMKTLSFFGGLIRAQSSKILQSKNSQTYFQQTGNSTGSNSWRYFPKFTYSQVYATSAEFLQKRRPLIGPVDCPSSSPEEDL